MKPNHQFYMQLAKQYATLSNAKRKQVGAVLITSTGVVVPGFNGTPSGWDNTCEDSDNNTKPEVIHAELNCILKCAKEGISTTGASIYITLSPCRQCSAMIAQAGIKTVYISEFYRDVEGLDLLMQHGVQCVLLP